MNERSDPTHSAITAKELVQGLILQASRGETISVKETIAAIRRDGPHLMETDDALIELIVDIAPAFGLSVEFTSTASEQLSHLEISAKFRSPWNPFIVCKLRRHLGKPRMRVPDKKTKAFHELIASEDNRRVLRRRSDLAVEAKLTPNLVSLLEELERLERELAKLERELELAKLEQGLDKKNHG